MMKNAAVGLSRKDVTRIAKELAAVDVKRSALEICFIWAQILVALSAFYIYENWIFFLFVFVFIASRQYALLVLLHDAQHNLLSRNKKLNDFLAQWLIAAPCGTIYENSRAAHLAHHQFLGDSDRDPAYTIYSANAPWPKNLLRDFIRFYLFRILGSKFQSLLKGASSGADGQAKTPALGSIAKKLYPVAVCQLLLLAGFSLAFGWHMWVLLWFLPLLTLVVLFDDFRQFCEHSNETGNATGEDDILISYRSGYFERFFFAPNHMNYHAEHHLFPFVPHRKLPALRRAIKKSPELRDRIQWRGSYARHFLRYLKARKAELKVHQPVRA